MKFYIKIFLFCGLFIANSYAVRTMNLFIALNYLAPQTIIDFEKLCKCKLSQSFYNDPNEMLAKMVAGGSGYDVIEATSYAVQELAKMNKLQKLDKTKIVGLNNIESKYLNLEYDKGNIYSVPYAYTPVFLAYNKDKLQELGITPDTWGVIFDIKYLKKLKGHITVFSSSRNVFAAALLYLGKNPNSTDIRDLNLAKDLINKSSPYWAKFDSDGYYRGLLRGDIWVAMGYSVDVYKTIQDLKQSKSSIKIEGMLQKEGNMYEMDNLVIPKDAANLDLAYSFINTALSVRGAYFLSLATGASIPNSIASKQVSLELKQTPWIYPPKTSKMFTFLAYDPKTRIITNEMWTEIQMQCGL